MTEMENNQLNQVIQDVEYAKKCIQQALFAYRNGVFTEDERKYIDSFIPNFYQ